jgi:hypothetical protein
MVVALYLNLFFKTNLSITLMGGEKLPAIGYCAFLRAVCASLHKLKKAQECLKSQTRTKVKAIFFKVNFIG